MGKDEDDVKVGDEVMVMEYPFVENYKAVYDDMEFVRK